MSEFAAIINAVHGTVASLHGVRVRYSYTDPGGDRVRVTITNAIPTASSEAVDVADGVLMVDAKARDFLIRTIDLPNPANPHEPQRGDTIEECDPDTFAVLATYTVMPATTGSPAWRWHDRTRQVRRIHTKETAVVTP